MIFLFLLFYFVGHNEAEQHGQQSKDLWNLMLSEHKAGRVMGYIDGLFPTSAKFYNGDLGVILDKNLLKNDKAEVARDITVFGGKSVDIKATTYPIFIDMVPPSTKENVCGLIIGFASTNNPIKKIQLLWKTKSQLPWDLLAVPSTGEYLFNLDGGKNTDKRVILFDPVPLSNIRLLIHATNGMGLAINAALIFGCQYQATVKVTCNEVVDQNARFSGMKEGIPMSIRCPSSCPKAKSCTGFKVYSSDNPICHVAEQALGNNGDGQFFLYKIAKVAVFRDQVNPELNHKIYCKKSTIPHAGITFNRVYYDFSVKEYKKLKGS